MTSISEEFSDVTPLSWRTRKFIHQTLSMTLWRQRLSFWLGAIALGLLAAGFSKVADHVQALFLVAVKVDPYLPLLISPVVFGATAWMTRKWFPSIPGSGIPQAIAAHKTREAAQRQWLLGPRVIFGKMALTALGLLGGASIGREGPTVQVGAALMMLCSGTKAQNAVRGFILAGASAGVAAAFNTPIAGIVFAIEEMARGFQRRTSGLVLIAIVLSGAASMSILGNYNYFGRADAPFSLATDIWPLLVIGVFGGFTGSLFAWALTRGKALLQRLSRGLIGKYPVSFAIFCGFIVAALGVATHAATYGTGYALANDILHGKETASWGCSTAKFLATVLSAISGLPGGIFSPSLSVGAALGSSVSPWFPHTSVQMVVLLTMVAYFSGVTQAPITAAIIVFEVTGKAAMPAPLVAVAVLACGVSQLLSPVSLYHALARDFASLAARQATPSAPSSS
jgi:H+/Cl- antiporter ClcA